jgi:hypothetical protein
MIIPQELSLKISEFSGRPELGTSKAYILQEAVSLDISYSSIELQAKTLRLESLLKYVCTPLNLGIDLKIHQLKRQYGKHQRLVDVLKENECSIGVRLLRPDPNERGILDVTSDVPLMKELQSIPDISVDYRGRYAKITMSLEDTYNLIRLIYLTEAINDVPVNSFRSIIKLNGGHNDTEDSTQDDMHTLLEGSSGVTISDLLKECPDVDVMLTLRSQRVKHEFIQAILDGRVNMDHLSLINEMIQKDGSITVYTSYSSGGCEITCRDITGNDTSRVIECGDYYNIRSTLIQDDLHVTYSDPYQDFRCILELVKRCHCRLNESRLEVNVEEYQGACVNPVGTLDYRGLYPSSMMDILDSYPDLQAMLQSMQDDIP